MPDEEIKPTEETQEKPKPQERMLVPVTDDGEFAYLLDTNKFNHLQRLGAMFAASDLVPKHYKNQIANCTIGIAAAIRLQIDPLMFLQKTYIVQGRPGMEAQLAIALVNSRGRLKTGLHYRLDGEGDDRGCVAWGVDKDTGETLEGHRVTIRMARDDGWYGDAEGWKEGQNGKYRSKWYTLRDLMLTYRSATFFARVHRPESLLGFALLDELEDIEHNEPRNVTPEAERPMPPMPKEKEPTVEAAATPAEPDAPTHADLVEDAAEHAATLASESPREESKADAPKEGEPMPTELDIKALWRRHDAIYGKQDRSRVTKYLESKGRVSTKHLTMQEFADFMKILDEAEKAKK